MTNIIKQIKVKGVIYDIAPDLKTINNQSLYGTGNIDMITEEQVDNKINAKVSSVYRPKGSVASYKQLPNTGNQVGDVYNVLDTDDNYAWTDSSTWDKLGGTVDLSAYATIASVDEKLSHKVDDNTLNSYVKSTDLDQRNYQTKEQVDSNIDNRGFVTNKPNAFNYDNLANKPTIPGEYILPTASADVKGGVCAAPKTLEDTQEVHIDPETGKLFTKMVGGNVKRVVYEKIVDEGKYHKSVPVALATLQQFAYVTVKGYIDVDPGTVNNPVFEFTISVHNLLDPATTHICKEVPSSLTDIAYDYSVHMEVAYNKDTESIVFPKATAFYTNSMGQGNPKAEEVYIQYVDGLKIEGV